MNHKLLWMCVRKIEALAEEQKRMTEELKALLDPWPEEEEEWRPFQEMQLAWERAKREQNTP